MGNIHATVAHKLLAIMFSPVGRHRARGRRVIRRGALEHGGEPRENLGPASKMVVFFGHFCPSISGSRFSEKCEN